MKYIFLLYAIYSLTAFDLRAQRKNLVYTTDQNSNTVTVVDADNQQVLGSIVLGYPASSQKILHPLYNGEINVHGINYDPIRKKVAVVSTTSNSVVLIDAATAVAERKAYVGRNPHEPRFTRNGKEIWITVRGENYVSILDAHSLAEKTRVILSEGPGMVTFSNDGKTAYVSSSFDDNFWIVNTRSKKIVKTLKVPSTFSPFVNTTRDGREVWVTHKDVGMVTRIDTRSNSIIESFNTGAITNHIAFSDSLYFVSVGGENKVKVYSLSTDNEAKLIKEIVTQKMPHGIWYHPEKNQVYVVCELSNTLQIIDVMNLEILKTLPTGERPQALIPVSVEANAKRIIEYLRIAPTFKGPK
jgi:YVTN family beta-propeller protein